MQHRQTGPSPDAQPDESRMCEHKRRLTRWRAKHEARRMRQRPYECPICHYWHLTGIDHDGSRW